MRLGMSQDFLFVGRCRYAHHKGGSFTSMRGSDAPSVAEGAAHSGGDGEGVFAYDAA